jgi:hypothetical protein
MFILIVVASFTLAADVDAVKVVKDQTGYRLQVNGEDFFIKGMNWDFMPIGTTYTYSLWSQPDDIIMAALDLEMPLLKAMGVNAIRQYVGVPPKWVQYIYEKYGIYTVINHAFGRYGVDVDGAYIPNTDYSDKKIRKALLEQVREMVEEFKDTPGILIWMLGNENNYGLFWDGAETEALPGQPTKQEKRARHMYKLFNEAIKEIKEIDTKRPVAMVNGDLLFLDILAEEVTDLDIFASNMYRGYTFTDAFDRVKKELDLPFMMAEFGSDAYNARTGKEAQVEQAGYFLSNWKDLYVHSAGKGKTNNTIGGFTFQFSDGWWKTGQESNLDVHDNTASWPNGGYTFDYKEGSNNMNEEWFGICAKGPTDARGLYELYPRASYYTLQIVNELDPYSPGLNLDDIEKYFSDISVQEMYLKARGDHAALMVENQKAVYLSNAFIKMETYNTGGSQITTPASSDTDFDGYPGFLGFDHLQSFFATVAFAPNDNFTGSMTVNVLGHVPSNPIDEIFYENRGRDQEVRAIDGTYTITDVERVKVYRAEFNWDDDWFNLKGFYRTGHFHWGYEGDFFGLYPEANYGPNIDTYGGMAPIGVEFAGKRALNGLKVAFGPELWWGANPAFLVKYQKQLGPFETTLMYQKDLSSQSLATSSFAIPLPPTQKATVHIASNIGKLGVEVGGIWSGANRLGETFQIVADDVVYQDEIRAIDNFGGKVKLTYSKGRLNWYASGAMMGLVADGRVNGAYTFTGWRLKDSGVGNQTNFLTGFTYLIGNLQIAPNFLWQKPIVGPIPADSPAPARPRNVLDDPFAVIYNRETTAGEILLTYDPTPATWMYNWDSDIREDAKLAASIGFVYRHHPTTRDASIGILGDGRTLFAFDGAPPARDLWEAYARIVSKARPKLGMISNLFVGNGEANGNDPREIFRFGGDLRFVANSFKLITELKFNDWGPYDYHKDFNLTYPAQFALDLSKSFGPQGWLFDSMPRMGIKLSWRSLDEYSNRFDPDPTLAGANGTEWEIRTYLHMNINMQR